MLRSVNWAGPNVNEYFVSETYILKRTPEKAENFHEGKHVSIYVSLLQLPYNVLSIKKESFTWR